VVCCDETNESEVGMKIDNMYKYWLIFVSVILKCLYVCVCNRDNIKY